MLVIVILYCFSAMSMVPVPALFEKNLSCVKGRHYLVGMSQDGQESDKPDPPTQMSTVTRAVKFHIGVLLELCS